MPLHKAIERRDLCSLRSLLDSGENVDSKNEDGETPLFLAIKKINLECFNLLLQFKADVNICDNNMNTPLHIAVQKKVFADSKKTKQIIKTLLIKRADVNVLNKNGQSPFNVFVTNMKHDINTKFIKLFLQFKIDVNNKSNRDAFHYVINNFDDHTLLREFAFAGFKFTVEDVGNISLLHNASKKGYNYIVENLLKLGADVNSKYENSLLLHTTINQSNPNISVVKTLLKHGADVKNSLPYAGKNLTTDIVELLINYGANVNGVDNNGKTLFHRTTRPHLALILLDHGANVHSVDCEGKTPLHYAVDPDEEEETSDIELVKLLLKLNVNINHKDRNGKTPLHLAAKKGSHGKIIYTLLRYGAYVNCKDDTGSTPLHYAVKYRNDVETIALLKFNADLHCKNNLGKIPFDNSKFSPLKYNKKILGSLISYGCIYDVNNERFGVSNLKKKKI